MMGQRTEEQQTIIEAITGGETGKGYAFAGTGKTHTMREAAKELSIRLWYVCFNRANADEADATFPRNATCTTVHKPAYRDMVINGPIDRERVQFGSIMPLVKAIEDDKVVADLKPLVGGRKRKAALVAVRTLTRFCQSASKAPLPEHAPIEWISTFNSPKLATQAGAVAAGCVVDLWERLMDPDCPWPISGDVFLKAWALTDPDIAGRYGLILHDESQDANPVTMDLLLKQNCQQFWIGDSHQCQPANTMVKVVEPGAGKRASVARWLPIEEVRAGDFVVSYSIPQAHLHERGNRVDEVARRPYSGKLIRVEGVESGATSAYTYEHKCVAKVGSAFDDNWLVYLMRRGTDFRIGMCKGRHESQNGQLGLPLRVGREKADAAWVLSLHDSESAARVYENVVAWTYNVPTLLFETAGDTRASQEELDEFWETVGDKTANAVACLRDHGLVAYAPLIESNRLYVNRAQTIHAVNLWPGMELLTEAGWEQVRVSKEAYSGHVYSLKVDVDETYVADGIVTHNSIYGWRGAIDALKKAPGAGYPLTTSWRFGAPVAAVANEILSLLGETLPLIGGAETDAPVLDDAEIRRGTKAVLCRGNAGVLRETLDLLNGGKRVAVVGGVWETIKLMEAAYALYDERKTDHPEIGLFNGWDELLEFSQTDDGTSLRPVVRTVEDYGSDVPDLCKRLQHETLPPKREQEADVVVSTAHKAKGREWRGMVRMAEDFPPIVGFDEDENPVLRAEEARLLYVTVTRAREQLNMSGVRAQLRQDIETLRTGKRPEPNASSAPISLPLNSDHGAATSTAEALDVQESFWTSDQKDQEEDRNTCSVDVRSNDAAAVASGAFKYEAAYGLPVPEIHSEVVGYSDESPEDALGHLTRALFALTVIRDASEISVEDYTGELIHQAKG